MRRLIGWTGLVMCVLVAGVVALPTPASAWVAFAKITTATGPISGGVIQKGLEGQISVLGLGTGLAVNFDSGIKGPLEKDPFVIVKAFDTATPKLLTAISAGTTLTSVEITIFKTTPTGTSVPGFKILLTNAAILKLDTTYDPGADPSTLEKLALSYAKLTWTDLITGATGGTP